MHTPHDDFAVISAAPVALALAGRTYLVSKLTPRKLGRLQAALNAVAPDPRDKVRKLMEGLPSEVQIAMWRDACVEAQHWPLKLSTQEGTEKLLESPDGTTALLEVTLGGVNVGFDRAAAEDLADRVTTAELASLFRAASPGNPNDPKAGAAATGQPGAS